MDDDPSPCDNECAVRPKPYLDSCAEKAAEFFKEGGIQDCLLEEVNDLAGIVKDLKDRIVELEGGDS